MATQYKGVPEGASAVIPRLVCRDVEAQIEFCCEALGAVEALRRPGPDGRAAHAMLKFGPAMLMLEAVDQPANLVGHRRRALQQLGRFIDPTEQVTEVGGCRNHVTIIRHIYADVSWPAEQQFMGRVHRCPGTRDAHPDAAP